MGKITVWAAYFSATGTTKRVVDEVAATVARALSVGLQLRDFTLPQGREVPLHFGPKDIVILGTPVYAGRVPNVLLPYLKTMEGGGALGVPVVLFGNRDFDDALIELRDLMENGGFRTVGAGAFVGEHAFSRTLGGGRPDKDDMKQAADFGNEIARRILEKECYSPVLVPGVEAPYRGYFTPRDRTGRTVDFRKIRPVVDRELCNGCMKCTRLCPMGAISKADVGDYVGICIKCGACIKGCPLGARGYTDEGYLYHRWELEEEYDRRAEGKTFF